MDEGRAEVAAAVRAKYAPRLERALWEAESAVRHTYDCEIAEETQQAIQEAAETIDEEVRARKEPFMGDEIEQAVRAVRATYDELIQQEVAQRLATRATRRR